jgi:Domain of unknown function (DUF4111)/Nucleotidyltransferase domain
MAASKPPGEAEEVTYLRRLAGRLRELLGDRLIGVYAGGSYALGGYRPGRSDLDVAAVAETALAADLREAIVDRLRHESLSCPARGLELVIYRLDTARAASASRAFELNLNSGPAMPLRVEAGTDGRETHWFPIDRSILAQAGVALIGPPAEAVFASIPLAELMPALVESMRWHRRRSGPAADAVLNACRSLRFAREGLWSSKAEAGRWAIERGEAPRELASEAIAALDDGRQLDRDAVDRWLDEVLTRLPRPGGGPAQLKR